MMKVSRIGICLMIALLAAPFASLRAQGGEDLKTKFAPIYTAVPALSIAPDARGGALGDNGVATTPDISSQYWNAAKYAFNYSKAGVALSYTPWLRKLVNDVGLAYLSGFYKIGDSDLQAIGASVRYFSLGEVDDTQGEIGGIPAIINPYEMAIDVSYSRKLSESYSMAVALRYIRSDMNAQTTDDMTPANGYAADVSGYLEKYVMLGYSESLWSFGFNISNIGTKITYDGGNTNKFLPAKLQIGTGLLYPLDDFNTIGFYLDLSKYLVPSMPVLSNNPSDEEIEKYTKARADYESMGSIKGVFKSFTDSPQGFSGEMKEVMASIGVEYGYNDQFFLRGGYYYENENMGNRQYFSLGAGFKMSVFQLDAAYLISTVPSNPLDQTLRFSLSFDMDGLRNLFR